MHKSWTSNNKSNNISSNNTSKTAQLGNKINRTPSIKRPNTSINDHNTNKRTKNEPKEKMSSELLQQLMSNNHNRGRPKGKSNWLLESSNQKAACISQPSDSVLMNLLVSGFDIRAGYICLAPTRSKRWSDVWIIRPIAVRVRWCKFSRGRYIYVFLY